MRRSTVVDLLLTAGLTVGLTVGLTACAPTPPADTQAIDEALPTATAPAPSGSSSPTRTATPELSEPAIDEEAIRDLVDKITIAPPRMGPVTGGDVSWPQCPEGMGIPEKQGKGLPMPLPSAEFVILGLTNGPAFTPNPCLAEQVRWVKERRLMAAAYSVSSYPDDETLERYRNEGPFDGDDRLGALNNVGFQQARYNLRTMRAAGLETPVVWVDVEPVPVFEWSPDTEANAAVVRGAVQGYLTAGYNVGVYSTQALWAAVVGDAELGLSEWRAAGQTSREEALARCGRDRSFQGGPAVIAQWVEDDRDRNITCPGTEVEMGRWFHQY